jgi:four helix bundle protein
VRSEFRDFTAYRGARGLARDLYRSIKQWPALDQWTVGVQLIRAADSVGANIAEASGRWQPADKKRLLVIARASLYETEHWLDWAAERSLLGDLTDRLDPIARSLAGLINAQRNR